MFWGWHRTNLAIDTIRKHSHRLSHRPGLECLEDRTLPTVNPLNFVVDPTLSSLTLSGSLRSSDLQPQGAGSLTTSYTGTIATSYDPVNCTLQFDPAGTNLVANESGDWQPLADGSSSSEAANYGGSVADSLGTARLALRDFAVTVTTGFPRRVDRTGSFASSQTLTPTAGHLDYQDDLLGSGTISLAGQSATNGATTMGRISNDPTGSGAYRLIVPIDFTVTLDVPGQAATLHVAGTVVATARIPVVNLNGEPGTDTGYSTTFASSVAGRVHLTDPGATITSDGAQQLTRLVVTLTNNPNRTAGFLAADTTSTDLTATYDSAADVLTVSGDGSLADYQTVLRTVTWNTTANSDFNTRFFTFAVTDAGGHSSFVSVTDLRSPLQDTLYLAIDPNGYSPVGTDPPPSLDHDNLPNAFRCSGDLEGAAPGGTITATLTDQCGNPVPDSTTTYPGVRRSDDPTRWYVDVNPGASSPNLRTLRLTVIYSNIETASDTASIQSMVQWI